MEKEIWITLMLKKIIDIQKAVLLIGSPEIKWQTKKDDINPKRFNEHYQVDHTKAKQK